MFMIADRISNSYLLSRETVFTNCRRTLRSVQSCVHDETATMHNHNMVQMSVAQKEFPLSSVMMYITDKSFFGGESMAFLMDKMVACKTTDSALMFHSVLQNNFYMHPPCAKYMAEQYFKLMLFPSENHFGGMRYWDFLIDCLKKIVDGSYSYGRNRDADIGFKKSFSFALTLLQFDYETSVFNKVESLIIKCLNYNMAETGGINGLSHLLNMVYNVDVDLKVLAIDFAVLLNHIELE